MLPERDDWQQPALSSTDTAGRQPDSEKLAVIHRVSTLFEVAFVGLSFASRRPPTLDRLPGETKRIWLVTPGHDTIFLPVRICRTQL